MSPKKAKRFRLNKECIIGYLVEALEGDRPLAEITRKDARKFRDHLLTKSLAITTVNKYMRLVGTIWTVAAQDVELTAVNPFARHSIADPTPDKDKRNPLTKDEVAALLLRRSSMGSELAAILTLVTYTGARIAEISGLN